MISSNQQILIVIIIGIIIIFFLYNRSEGFVTNTEAIQNIASLYNTGNLTGTNITATGDIKGLDLSTRDIKARFIEAGVDVDAKRNMNVGSNITAGNDITAPNIIATNKITTTGDIKGLDLSTRDIKARFIEAGVDVDAKRNMNVGANITAGNDITAKHWICINNTCINEDNLKNMKR
jgi:hypothetical protein